MVPSQKKKEREVQYLVGDKHGERGEKSKASPLPVCRTLRRPGGKEKKKKWTFFDVVYGLLVLSRGKKRRKMVPG